MDLGITQLFGWEEEDKIFYKSLSENLKEYVQYLKENLYTNLDEFDLIDISEFGNYKDINEMYIDL